MMTAFTTAITDAAQRELADVVQRLAKHYGFNYLDAMRMLGDDLSPVKQGTPLKPVQVPSPEPEGEPVQEFDPVKEARKQEKKEKKKAEKLAEKRAAKKALKEKKESEKKESEKKEEPKEKYEKPKFVLPWTGVVVPTWCQGLRPNKDLLSQCNQKPKSDGLCATCFKQFQNDGKTKCGTVDDRLAADAEGRVYKNPETGKAPALYGAVLKKMKVSREDAEAEAAKFGITIPEEQFEVPRAKKGRPPSTKPKTKGEDMLNEMIAKAVAAVSSTEESESETEQSAPKSPVESTPEAMPALVEAENVFEAETVANSEPKKATNSAEADYDAETEDEDDEIKVERFEHDGTKYLRDVAHNILYDEKTQEAIGVWDPATKTIKPCDPESSDEEE